MNADKLKGKITECRKTYQDCADTLGITKASFNSKMNGKSRFYIDEVAALGKYLCMQEREIVDIFLHENFHNMEVWQGGEKMELTKSEEFAKKIIQMAAEEKLTVVEFYRAADIAKGISDNSTVDVESVERTDFPSQHISTCDEKGLFRD